MKKALLFFTLLLFSITLLAQVPTITSFTPATAKPGDAVTITGANFNTTANNNVVYFGATRATVTTASATSLTVTVPNGATYDYVTVLNTGNSLATQSLTKFHPTYSPNKTGIITMNAKTDFATNNNPYSVAIGDLDGDGKSDLAVTYQSSGYVSVLRNTSSNGTMSFDTKVDFPTGTLSYSVATGDIDADGKLDLVVANNGISTVSVLRNTSSNGSISFDTKVDFATGFASQSVAIGDINGDGKLDIATANKDVNKISVLQNTSTIGVITFATKVDFSTGVFPTSVVIGDIDGDAKPDMVVANEADNEISVLRNTGSSGSINFASRVNFAIGSQPQVCLLGDLDGDGKLDLAVVYRGNAVAVLQNSSSSGSISFAAKVDFATGINPTFVAMGDIDGDGKPDLAVTNRNDNTASILRNTSSSGSISFAAKADFATGSTPSGLTLGDLDNDGRTDIALTNTFSTSVSVLRNADLPPTITSFTPATAKPGDAVTITGANFNTTANNNVVYFGATRATVTTASATSLTVTVPVGATYAPIAVLNSGTKLVAMSTSNFQPAFNPVKTGLITMDNPASFATGSSPNIVAMGDLDGDGKTDLVVGYSGSSTISVFRNTSSSGSISTASFASKVDFSASSSSYGIALADVDNDGKLDIISVNSGSASVSVLKNTSTSGIIDASSFANKVDFTVGASPRAIAVGDLDGDGKIDLAVTNSNANTVSILGNTAISGIINSSSFAAKVDFATGSSPNSVAIGDLDADGKPDIAVANIGSNTVSVLRNTSTHGIINSSSFGAKVDFVTESNPYSVTIGDLDKDGKLDLAVAGYANYKISVLRNTSTSGTIDASSFAAKVDFGLPQYHNPTFVTLSDLDGDSKLDIIAAINASSSAALVALRNTSTSGSINSSSFSKAVNFASGSNGNAVVAGDLDGDNRPDLAVVNVNANTLSVLRNEDLPVSPPTITSFSPAKAKPGDQLTITGTNYNTTLANNVVFFGTTKATVTGASNTQLTVTVPVGATQDFISVLNTSLGLTAMSSTSFHPIYSPAKTGAMTFDAKAEISLGNNGDDVYVLAKGDIDGDGKTDLIRSDQSGSNLSIYKNISTTGSLSASSFATRVIINTGGNNIRSIKVIDIDRDGKQDIVGRNSNGIFILPNIISNNTIDNTSFAAVVNLSLFNLYGFNIADIDGDGKPDLITSFSNGLRVLKNKSSVGNITNQSFGQAVDFINTISAYTEVSPEISDIDGDGKLDVIYAITGNNKFSVFRNQSILGDINGDSFASPVEFTANFPISLTSADIDGDGKPELITTSQSGANLSVFQNTATSGVINSNSFAPNVDFAINFASNYLAVGDIDGDGKVDLALLNNNNKLNILRNTSTLGSINSNSFAAIEELTQVNNNKGIIIADLDGDHKPDIAAIGKDAGFSTNVLVLLRNEDLPVPPPTITSFSPSNAKPGDVVTITGTNFNTTASNNIVFFGATKANVTNATATSLTVTVPSGASSAPISVLNTGINLTAISGTRFQPSYSPAKTGINFDPKVDFSTPSHSPNFTITGDLDGDGKADIVVGNSTPFTLSVYRNTTSGINFSSNSLANKVDFSLTTQPRKILLVDVNNDGKLDIVAFGDGSPRKVSILRNTATSGDINSNSFAAEVSFTIQNNSENYIGMDDIDGDGRIDIIAGKNDGIQLLRNISKVGDASNINFAQMVSIKVGSNENIAAITVGDLDGDGKPDIVGTHTFSNKFFVLRNTAIRGSIGVNSFATATEFATTSAPKGAAIGDLDGDGKAEIALSFSNSPSTIHVYKNVSTTGTLDNSSFNAPVSFTVDANYAEAKDLKIVDMNGDGKADLIFGYSGSKIGVLKNITTNGVINTNSFESIATVYNYNGLNNFAVTDLDNDGKPDLIVTRDDNSSSTIRELSIIRNADIPPTITSFTPATAKPGDAVTITGANFNTTANNNVVYFGATRATVTIASATSLTVTVPVGATYAPITLLNTSISLAAQSASNFIPVFSPVKTGITMADFAPKQDFTTGIDSYSADIGDLDGDGKSDLVVANLSSNTISVFRNTSTMGSIGSGSFAVKQDFTTGSNPISVKIGDLDGDGKPDLVVANQNSNTISVFHNTSTIGNSSFAVKQDFTTGSSPNSVAIGDLDGDGKPDLSVVNRNLNTVSVLRNTSNMGSIGSSSFAARQDFTTGSSPVSVAIGDLDNDAKPDMLVANLSSNTISVFRNTSTIGSIGSSSFATKQDFVTGSLPRSVAIGDLDSDGKADLAVVNQNSNTISVFHNTSTMGSIGSSSFAARQDFTSSSSPFSVEIGDLDGDGKPDLAISNTISNTVSIFSNTSTSGSIGSSSFAARQDFTTGSSPFSVAIGDLDGDSKPDLAVANAISNTISVFRNADLPPTITSFTPAKAKPGDVVTITGTNFNTTATNNVVFFGATKATVTSASLTSLTVTVPSGATYAPITILNTTIGLTGQSITPFHPVYSPAKTLFTNTDFDPKVNYATGNNPNAVVTGDLDGDGNPDVAVLNNTDNTVSVFRNTGNGTTINFAAKLDFVTGGAPSSMAIKDIDGDGKLDLAIANRNQSSVSILRNTGSIGNISFATKIDIITGSSPSAVALADLDGDGKMDLISANFGSDNFTISRNIGNVGNLSFDAATTFTTGSGPNALAVADLDGDGKMDIAVTNFGANNVSLFRNTSTFGTFSFTLQNSYATQTFPKSVVLSDLDGDAKAEMVVVNTGSNTISVYKNTSSSGTISFSSNGDNYYAMDGPQQVVVGDVDGDGKADLAVANINASAVSLFKNNSNSNFFAFDKTTHTTGTNPISLALTDLDGDGRPDLVVADNNSSDNSISVLRNSDISVIQSTGSLTAMSSTYGTASASQSFAVSGTKMVAGILVSPPTGFEVSTDNITFSPTVTVGSSGTIASTTVYVRLSATAAAGAYSGNIVLSSTNAANVNVATVSSTVSKKDLSITGIAISNKVYDDNTTATITGTASLSGIVGSDVITISGTPQASFNNANVGTGKAITITGYDFTGAAANNYTISQPTGLTADITAKGLTIAGISINNKVYDGTTTASITGTATLSGVVGSDAVSFNASIVANFNNKNIGTNKAVTVSGFSLTGADASNYSLTQPTGLTANITAKALTVSAVGTNKIYDGNTTAEVTLSDDRITNDNLTTAYTAATFNNKNVGTNKTVSVTGITVTGTDATNYTFNTTASTTANITAKALTVTAVGSNKTYDGNTIATVSLSDDRIANDNLTTAYTGATFNNKNVGTGKAISVSGISISGTDAANYTANTSANASAAITAKALLVTATGNNKVYDGNTSATVTLSDNKVSGDALIAVYTLANFDNKNVATGKTISVSGISISGTDAGNYTFNTTTSTTANITAKPLTITAADKQKFVGTVNPVFTANYNGFVVGEDASILTTQPSFSTTAVLNSPLGNYPITVSGAVAQNYSISYVNGTLSIVPGAPTSISLATVTLFENRPSGTLAGTLSSTSDDPNASFTYSLVTGTGSTDNASFMISGNQLQTAASLNYEAKQSYQIRVRSTTQFGFSLEQTFIVNLSDVNEAPTLNSIANQRIYFRQGVTERITLQNLTSGPESNQSVQTLITSNNPGLFQSLSANNSQISYVINNGQTGTATITITVRDNGGTANGGIDQISRTFNLTVDAAPLLTGTGTDIGSNLETPYTVNPEIGRGLSSKLKLEVADAQSYSWSGAGLSSYNISNPVASPSTTTTYTVSITNSSGFTTTASITVNVKDDYVVVADNNFSPNGDGINDFWKVQNIDTYPNHELTIVDRGGRVLYRTRAYRNDWDGKIDGRPLEDGTYYYMIRFDDTTIRPVKGFITILK